MDKRLIELATRFAQGGGGEQFEVILRARGQTITAGTVAAYQHPGRPGQAGGASNDLLITPTEVRYTRGRPSAPGWRPARP